MRSPSVVVLLSLSLFAAEGCHRGRYSPEYTQAQSLFDQVYAEKQDDAYADPRMQQVKTLLSQVPASSLDAESAQALRAKIESGEQALRDRLAAAENPPPEQPAETVWDDEGEKKSDDPMVGMKEDDFALRYGNCFQRGPSVNVNGKGERVLWELKPTQPCKLRYPGFVDRYLVPEDGTIAQIVPRAAVRATVVVVDAGAPAAPPDAGAPAPRPAAAPPPPQPAAPPNPDTNVQYGPAETSTPTAPPPAPPPAAEPNIHYDSSVNDGRTGRTY